MDKNKYWILDGHTDAMLAIPRQKRSFAVRSEIGHVDKERMREGNIKAALFAVFPAFTKRMIKKGVENWFEIVNNEENELMQIKNYDDFEKSQAEGKIGAVLHFEGVGGFDKNLNSLHYYKNLGLRTMGITWSNKNKFGTGVSFIGKEKKRGLTEKGRELIHEAQSLGITIDVSHLNELSFWDVIEITEKPIIASHSDSRTICDHTRNLTDEQIKAIFEKHGTIGINMGMVFLNPNNPGKKDPEMGFDVIKKHIDQIVACSDINTVAMGSDFDGIKTPNCMKDCAQYPRLFDYLAENGYSEQDIKKISHENLLRVFSKTWN
ncbi:MAG: dipeptidase [Promethearchaeota archaeon]